MFLHLPYIHSLFILCIMHKHVYVYTDRRLSSSVSRWFPSKHSDALWTNDFGYSSFTRGSFLLYFFITRYKLVFKIRQNPSTHTYLVCHRVNARMYALTYAVYDVARRDFVLFFIFSCFLTPAIWFRFFLFMFTTLFCLFLFRPGNNDDISLYHTRVSCSYRNMYRTWIRITNTQDARALSHPLLTVWNG